MGLLLRQLLQYRCDQTIIPCAPCLSITTYTEVVNSTNSTQTNSTGYKCSEFAGSLECPWGDPSLSQCWQVETTLTGAGTPSLDSVHWQCGHKLNTNLPTGWGGVRAPVRVTDHMFILAAERNVQPSRRTRSRWKLNHTMVCGDWTCRTVISFGRKGTKMQHKEPKYKLASWMLPPPRQDRKQRTQRA